MVDNGNSFYISGLPSSGCNIFYGNYIDNYAGGQRTRYYIYDGKAYASTRTTGNTPTGAICLDSNIGTNSDTWSVMWVFGVVVGVWAVWEGVKTVIGWLKH